MAEFEFIDEDTQAVEIATNVARRFLAHTSLTPFQIIGLGHAIYALERYPESTDGVSCEFGIEYRAGDNDFSEMRYITFRVSDCSFEISKGGSVYHKAVGSDSFSEPGWFVELGGYSNRACKLYDLEDSIQEYLNLGARIDVRDESEIETEIE